MIRAMIISDLPEVLVLENKLFSRPWTKENYSFELEGNPYGHYVVIDEKRIKGYLGLWLNEDALQVTTLGVDLKEQNKGYGQLLLSYVLEFAHDNKVSIITLEVRVSNEKAIHLYEKNGFIRAAIRKQYYSHPDEDAVLMMLKIK